MKKIISFSLWGKILRYTYGMIKNVELARTIYPGWIVRIYVDTSVPVEIIERLKDHENVELVFMNEAGDWNSMFWRFIAIDDSDVEIMLSRDADSRLSIREKVCVDEFIKSDKMFHSIIDHPFHGGIMGGMWGIKKGLIPSIGQLISSWEKTNEWQTDQSFLNKVIQPIVRDNNTWLLHDSIELKNFPTKRENYHFVGEIFGPEDDRYDHYCVLKENNIE